MKKLKEDLIRENDNLYSHNQRLFKEIKRQQDRIDKAIEYINKTQMGEGYKKMLLELLGSDKE